MELEKDAGLNVTLPGSVGTFSVGGSPNGQSSIRVRYFLSHVSLDFGSSANEDILSNIAPVREIFDFDELTFDELMQRDLDDARVSSELIPYLLDTESRDLVKLFPPIIIAVLPIRDDAKRPANYYPRVETLKEEEMIGRDEKGNPKFRDYKILRAGKRGNEVFQFEQPIHEGEVREHDLVRFKVNNNRAKLVIVDGQHRAMALLALYRNLKGEWQGENEDKYKEYYSQWTKDYVQEFDIGQVSLPMMICTFPELDDTYEGDFNLKKAAREIFLTLNKTARKVSETRNILLDDNDIIASFLRRTLEEIKSKDVRSDFSLRIHNVELDQSKDRIKLKDPVAVTGVNHIYYIIEHAILSEPESDVSGISSRSGRFGARTDLSSYNGLLRLNGYDRLGRKEANKTDRRNFSESAEDCLIGEFFENYGKYIVRIFEEIKIYERHNYASLKEKKELKKDKDRKVKPILYEGQGIARNFRRHKENLEDQLEQGYFGDKSPEVNAVLENLDATEERIDTAVRNLRSMRLEEYLSDMDISKVSDQNGSIYENISKWVNETYKNIYKSVAFQTALFCTFFDQIERAYPPYKNESTNVEELFSEYIDGINSFFTPSNASELRKLIMVFEGEPDDNNNWKVKPTPNTFSRVVSPRAMNPDKWTHYRYLLLELWSPSDEKVEGVNDDSVERCRRDVFSKLYERNKSQFCEDNRLFEEDLTTNQKSTIASESFDQFNSFLNNVDSSQSDKTEFVKSVIGINLDE